ncbi:DegT/DnrJ/EryC1/StrS family aminotransferase [Patescibacteria group bacterium]|nr:DegT/DnrJ/EryC1/StrS family aminotransferase [Patescibacteria group bacterium]
MSVFNSLGSNYDFSFVVRTLFAGNKAGYRLQLIEYLKKKYGGEVLLTYKGREALRLALRIAGLSKKYTVGICGFTCYAVYEAVVREGYKVRYLDIAEGDLNFSFEKFIEGIHKHPSMKLLIVQNTLGFPCEMEKISKFCKERKIVLIEDLAHSIGAEYFEEQEAGTVGDYIVLSFSQDKMVDGISGGAVIIKDQRSKIKDQRFINIPLAQQWRDRFYPLLTWIIRETYSFGLGKVLHAIFKKLDLLSKPMGQLQTDKIYRLPNWYCHLIYRQFMGLEEDLTHRRKIASIYANGIHKSVLLNVLMSQISKSSNLRFPIFVPLRSDFAKASSGKQGYEGQVEKREELIAFLNKQGIFVSDIWYDSPIAPKRFLRLTDYDHECPNSEKVSSMILNLPTHRNVSERDAEYIVGKVNEWMKFQVKSQNHK